MTTTAKMLSRKEGRVGIMTFNNPERHNAVSLEMWQAAHRHPARISPGTMRCAWWSSRAPAARRSCPAPTSPSSRASAPPARRSSATTPSARRFYTSLDQLPQADHRPDPGLLHRRRPEPRHRLRPALLHRGLALRPARRQARPRLRLLGPQALHRHGRARQHQGHLLLRAPVRRRRGAGDGRRQQGAARGASSPPSSGTTPPRSPRTRRSPSPPSSRRRSRPSRPRASAT